MVLTTNADSPVLTNVSTLRVFTGFYFNTQVTTWISDLGKHAIAGKTTRNGWQLITNAQDP